jgi:Obg family GTPase CgtA-like protein
MRTVQKPWGKEEIWAETPKYVGKYLHINAGHRLSRQYHERKEETIRVLSGKLILEVGSGDNAPIAVLAASSATGEGLDDLKREIFAALPADAVSAPKSTAAGTGAGHMIYRPGEDEGFEVVADGPGKWRIEGRGIELLFARHDLSNPEALGYLESRLKEIGVLAELRRAGFERGHEVIVGDEEFELDFS